MEAKLRKIMPLVSSEFAPGKIIETIESIEDPDERELAWAEYYQFTGRAKEAVEKARPYLDSEDPALKLSANIVCFISGLAMGDVDSARKIMRNVEELENDEVLPANWVYCANVFRVILFYSDEEFDLSDVIPAALSEGVKCLICYFLALREFLIDEYDKAIGIARSALLLGGNRYPIADIYLHIVSAISYMRKKKVKKAEEHFYKAWGKAEPDGFIAPFGQQYITLAGLNKKCVKDINEEKYNEINSYAKVFLPAWIDVHYGLVDWHVDHNLTRVEHIVAMLFRKGFKVKEIAACMNISINTVKSHITSAYNKTGAQKREELPEYIIR